METFYEATPKLVAKSAIALGFFDGVHPGHKAVISKAVEEAKNIDAKACVVTFKDHPRMLTRGASPLLLTVIEQRLELFASLGVETTLALSFTEDLCKLTAREYVQSILLDSLGAKSISIGHNHHFGRDREGNPELMRKFGQEMGFAVHVAPMIYFDNTEISSSRVRELVVSGNVESAQNLLTRPYSIYGEVVQGEGRGRKLGFPTANMKLYEFQCIPKGGVYMGRARLEDGRIFTSVINVGYRPTFKAQGQTAGHETKQGQVSPGSQTVNELLVEVHLLDFNQFIYGQKLYVEFLKYLRSEQKFDGVEALKRQIDLDCRATRELSNKPTP